MGSQGHRGCSSWRDSNWWTLSSAVSQRGESIPDPQDGPGPPAWCYVGADSVSTVQVTETSNLPGRSRLPESLLFHWSQLRPGPRLLALQRRVIKAPAGGITPFLRASNPEQSRLLRPSHLAQHTPAPKGSPLTPSY